MAQANKKLALNKSKQRNLNINETSEQSRTTLNGSSSRLQLHSEIKNSSLVFKTKAKKGEAEELRIGGAGLSNIHNEQSTMMTFSPQSNHAWAKNTPS